MRFFLFCIVPALMGMAITMLAQTVADRDQQIEALQQCISAKSNCEGATR